MTKIWGSGVSNIMIQTEGLHSILYGNADLRTKRQVNTP